MVDERVVEVDGTLYGVSLELWSRATAEAELRVLRRRLSADLAAVDDDLADERLESTWLATVGEWLPASRIRDLAPQLLAELDRYEDRQRTRLRLPPRHKTP